MEDVPCSLITTFNSAGRKHTTQEIHRLNPIPIKIPMALTAEINKNPKLLMNFLKTQVKPKQSRKKHKAGGIILLDFILYYYTKLQLLKKKMYGTCTKNRHID